MPLTDLQGRAYAHSKTVKVGDKVETDGDFTCLHKGTVREVKSFAGPLPHHDAEYLKDPFARLYIACRDEGGMHFLDGQVGADGELVGLYPA